MKKIFNTFTLTLLSFSFLIGCGEEPTTSLENSSFSSSSKVIESTYSSTKEDDIVPIEIINEFIISLQNNYTVIEQNSSSEYIKYMFDNEKMQKFNSKYDIRGEYLTIENDNIYSYTYDTSDALWHKNDVNEEIDFDSFIIDKLENSEWKEYDKETSTFIGLFSNKEVTAKVSSDRLKIQDDQEYSLEVFDIGETSISLPSQDKIVDHTTSIPDNPGETPEPDEPTPDLPVQEEKNIYDVDDQGTYNFNIVLLKDLLLNWMKGDNQWGVDVLVKRILTSDAQTLDILYVNPLDTGIDYAFKFKAREEIYVRNFILDDEVLLEGIKNQTIKTQEEFVDYINSIQLQRISIGSMFETIDTTISEEHMDIITKNIFNRLSTVGTQEHMDNEPIPYKGLENIEIFKSFKSIASSVTAGAGLGNCSSSDYYYFAEVDNKIELIIIHVPATEHISGLNYYVINNTEGRWFVFSCNRISLNYGNKELFN